MATLTPVDNAMTLGQGLPKHWGWRQRLKNHIVYAAIRIFYALFLLIPFQFSYALAKPLGILAYYLAVSERKKAIKHLRIAFPDKDDAWIQKQAKGMFIHLGRCAVESAHIKRFLYGPRRVHLNDQDLPLYEEVLAEGRGAIGITGHIGNWELLAQAGIESGIPIGVIAKPAYDPRITRLAHDLRCTKGLQIIYRKGGRTRDKMLQVIKEGGMLAMLIDQDTKSPGDFVPFFGKLAHTPTTAARIAIERNLPVLVGWIHRQPDGSFRTGAKRVAVPNTGDIETDVLTLTQNLNQTLEDAIRMAPEQWVWLHRRWRRRPPKNSE